jgi:hypothetical protein
MIQSGDDMESNYRIIMSTFKPPRLDALLSSGVNVENQNVQLVVGTTSNRQMYPMEIEPGIVPSIITALKVNLAEVDLLWPGKVKDTFAGLVSRRATVIANKDVSVALVIELDDGLELTVHLKPDRPASLLKLEEAAKALSQRDN